MPAKKKQRSKPRRQKKELGILLTLWLLLMLLANIAGAATYFLFSSEIALMLPDAPSQIFYAYGTLNLVNVVLTIFLFLWKKWAFFAFCGIAVIALIMNLMVGLGLTSLGGLLGPIILYLILRPKWHLLENR